MQCPAVGTVEGGGNPALAGHALTQAAPAVGDAVGFFLQAADALPELVEALGGLRSRQAVVDALRKRC